MTRAKALVELEKLEEALASQNPELLAEIEVLLCFVTAGSEVAISGGYRQRPAALEAWPP